MRVVQIIDSKVIKVGVEKYEAHVYVSYKTIFGTLKLKWIKLDNYNWGGSDYVFSSVVEAKRAITDYITEVSCENKETVVFRGIPE